MLKKLILKSIAVVISCSVMFGGLRSIELFAQDPSVNTTLAVISDGQAPFDTTTYVAPDTNAGTDSSANNGVVRVNDYITYQMDINLNGTDQDNVIGTLELDPSSTKKQVFEEIPSECLTEGVVPVSSISTDKRTLTCNVGFRREGTTVRVLAPVLVDGNNQNNNIVNAQSIGSSDLAPASTPFISLNTLVTASFKVDLIKDYKDPVFVPDPGGDLQDAWEPTPATGPLGEDGFVGEYRISLEAQPGSEAILPDSGTLKDFVLSDIITDDNPVLGSPSNAQLYTWGSDAACEKEGTSITGALTCTENSAGNFTITLDDVDVTYPDGTSTVFSFIMRLWVDEADLIDFGGELRLLTQNTVTGIDGITSVTGLQNYNGAGEPLANNTKDARYRATTPGSWSANKFIYGISSVSTGSFVVAPGETFQSQLQLIDRNLFNNRSAVCDTIDTTHLEYAGFNPGYDGTNAILRVYPSPYQNLVNPFFQYDRDPNNAFISGVEMDPYEFGITLEYTTKAVTDLVATPCTDDWDGVPGYDWEDLNANPPANNADVTRVRMVLDKDFNQIITTKTELGYLIPETAAPFWTFDLKVKETTPAGTIVPNFGQATTESRPGYNLTPIIYGVSLDQNDPNYALTGISDRVTIVGNRIGIEKSTLDPELYDVNAGDEVEFTIQPKFYGNNPLTPVELTVVDTLEAGEAEFVSNSFTVTGSNGTVTGPVISGNVATWTITDADLEAPLPLLGYSVRINPDLVEEYINNSATITSNNLQINQDSDPACDGCASPRPVRSADQLRVTASGGYNVRKDKLAEVYEVESNFPYTLIYKNENPYDYSAGDHIEVLPFNGDDTASTLRESDLPAYSNTASDFSGTVELNSIPSSPNGEVWSYTTANPSTISLDPCHSSNQVVGYIPASGDVCYEFYTINGGQLPNGEVSGTGEVVWNTLDGSVDLSTVTAIRFATPLHASGAVKSVSIDVKATGNVENDVYCNNYGGRVVENTLPVVSNDVCVRVVGGTISGSVWNDNDQSGTSLPEVGEPFYDGLTVALFYDDGQPVLKNGIAVTTTTDVNGFYEFTDLPSDTYYTQVTWNGTTTPDVTYTTDNSVTYPYSPTGLTVQSGDHTLTQQLDGEGRLEEISDEINVNYSFDGAASLGDYVWLDTNANGIQDAGDTPLEGVTVTLYNGNGTVATTDLSGNTITPTITDINGLYSFTNLAPNDYYVVIDSSTTTSTLPNGAAANDLIVTKQNDPNTLGLGNDTDDSDIDGAGESDTVTLNFGDNNTTLDAGYFIPATLGDYTWLDVNGNGIQDSGDIQLEGVTVTLYNGDGSLATVDASGNTINPALTDIEGGYTFTNLIPGEYYVIMDPSTSSTILPNDSLASDLVPTRQDDPTSVGVGDDSDDSDIALNTYQSNTVTIVSAETNLTLDAGFIIPATLGDYVFEDVNGDGIQNTGDQPLEGVTVTLYNGNGTLATTDASGNTIVPTTTDIEGGYTFTNLIPGEYYVVIDASTSTDDNAANFVVTTQNSVIATGETDSDVDPNTNQTSLITLAPGESNLTLDAGYYAPATLGDYVWIDANADGVQQVGVELPLEGVSVTLYNGNGTLATTDANGNAIVPTTTDANGVYQFTNLIPGEYYVVFDSTTATSTLPNGASANDLIVTTQDDANGVGMGNDSDDSDIDPTNQVSNTITLESGDSTLTLDAGYYLPATVGNYVWIDANGDGIQDLTELPLEGVTVSLTDTDGNQVLDVLGDPILPVSTDVDGLYTFDNLIPGQYELVFDVSTAVNGSEYYITTQNSTSGLGDDTDDSDINTNQETGVFTLASGDVNETFDAGYFIPASVGNYVFEDTNANGIQDAGDTPLEGITVSLTDNNANPVVDADGNAVESVLTDENGLYTFPNLVPGDYIVVFTTPAGMVETVIDDANTNGLGDDTDDSDGLSVSVTLVSGENNETIDSGFYTPASLGDYVFEDVNGDGIQNTGDQPLEGVTVTLYNGDGSLATTDASGNAIAPTTTDIEGGYTFTNLIPGEYYVVIDASTSTDDNAAQLLATIQDSTLSSEETDSDIDQSTNQSSSVVLSSGDNNTSLDAGYFAPASIGNYVWIDTNFNGIQDGTDTPLEGVTVTLYNGDGSLATTDASGNTIVPIISNFEGEYQFTNLIPGEYFVEFTNPEGMVFTIANENTIGDDTTDSDSQFVTENGDISTTSSVSLVSGENNDTLDGGFVEPSSLGSFVWEDENYDGIYSAETENGVNGITVTLLNVDGTRAVDLYGNVIPPLVTSNNPSNGNAGYYNFVNLLPGDYRVGYSGIPANFIATLQNQGGDEGDSDVDELTFTTDTINLAYREANTTTFAGILREPTLTLEDPYQCGGGFSGIVANGYNPTVSINVFDGERLAFNYQAILNSDGTYSFPLDYQNSDAANFVESGLYRVVVVAVDTTGLTVSQILENVDIQENCIDATVRTGSGQNNYFLLLLLIVFGNIYIVKALLES